MHSLSAYRLKLHLWTLPHFAHIILPFNSSLYVLLSALYFLTFALVMSHRVSNLLLSRANVSIDRLFLSLGGLCPSQNVFLLSSKWELFPLGRNLKPFNLKSKVHDLVNVLSCHHHQVFFHFLSKIGILYPHMDHLVLISISWVDEDCYDSSILTCWWNILSSIFGESSKIL